MEVWGLKKVLTIIVVIITVLIISGCNYNAKKISKELRELKLNQEFSIIAEDEEKYIGRIRYENNTNYEFMPINVFVQLQIRYMDKGVDTSKPNPIHLRANEINIANPKFEYEVEIPKKLFDVFERTDKENVSVYIDGFFIENERIVLKRTQGDNVRINLD